MPRVGAGFALRCGKTFKRAWLSNTPGSGDRSRRRRRCRPLPSSPNETHHVCAARTSVPPAPRPRPARPLLPVGAARAAAVGDGHLRRRPAAHDVLRHRARGHAAAGRALLPHERHRAGRRLRPRPAVGPAARPADACSGSAPWSAASAGPPWASSPSCGCRSSSASLALGVAGAAGAQVYAAVRDELSRRPTAVDVEVISTVRMGFTLGWVVGPVLGTIVGGVFGLRTVLFMTAALSVLQLVPMIGVRAPRFVAPPAPGGAPYARPVSRRALLPLLAFCALVDGRGLRRHGEVRLPAALHERAAAPVGRGPRRRHRAAARLRAGADAAGRAARPALRRRCGSSWPARPAPSPRTSATRRARASSGSSSRQVLLSAMWAGVAGLGVSVAQQLYPAGVGRGVVDVHELDRVRLDRRRPARQRLRLRPRDPRRLRRPRRAQRAARWSAWRSWPGGSTAAPEVAVEEP